MRVVVTGASGKLGRLTAELLIERMDPADLTLVTRHPDALSDCAARGANVERGDFEEAAQYGHAPRTQRSSDASAELEALFANADCMLLISTDTGHRIPQHHAAIEAAIAADVGRIVYTSITNPTACNPVIHATEHRETEQMLEDSGLAWTILRNTYYADVPLFHAVDVVARGELVTNAGQGRSSYVCHEDCAAVAAAVLSTEGHESTTYEVTGSEALSAFDIAAIYGEIVVQPVAVVEMDDDDYFAHLVDQGFPKLLARRTVTMGQAVREGFFDIVTPAVEDITGRPPRSLETHLRSRREMINAGGLAQTLMSPPGPSSGPDTVASS